MPKKEIPLLEHIRTYRVVEQEGNKNVSFSQVHTYHTCPRQWDLLYRRRLLPYQASIHTLFGTAFHETVQKWLEVLFQESAKKADEMDLDTFLYERMIALYKEQVEKMEGHFSTKEELQEFWEDGIQILDYLKKHRGEYFSPRTQKLVGIETPLYRELHPGIYFKGFIDVILYNTVTKTFQILDIKTSTSGWNSYAKTDEGKLSQLLLYRKYLSLQFSIPQDEISVEYFIVKRKIQEDAPYPAMRRRVQRFEPPMGKMKMNRAQEMVDLFISETLDLEKKDYVEKTYHANVKGKGCRFCPFRKTEHCLES